ncbi:glycosyltransferase [Nitratidesulfovibrio liaohensis]|uniref:Glycosyltransferase n=1 Tax=Nitratidesulfovibrio liaohensis TaxID=2604158 RepID=A0ABY9QYN8_9BACT|nr:glycosyltransferase [Nitratidesulfovibrio liaohensis]WMW64171.1 glycosyltransferase [Nitratidesulfovibrio liaohensis]
MTDTAAHSAPPAPTVSVIMNCLNCGEHLRAAIDSVFAQTFDDWEIVFWDNGSSDCSADIAQSCGDKVRYFRAERTVPLGAARNLAIARARGEFIAFLDCDDLWHPEKLARQVALFRANPAVGLVSCDTVMFSGDKELSRQFQAAPPARGKVFRELMTTQWISMSSAVIRRSALDAPGMGGHWFDESLNVCEEADVFYRIAWDWELDHVDAPLARWRVHGGSTTFRKFAQFADETEAILAKHIRMYRDYERDYADLVALLRRRAAFQRGVALWREGKGAAAREAIAPYVASSLKFRLFRLATFLPGGMFDAVAGVYFALPSFLRR